jgi:NTP pyrophosphatase (non-canonical NTP hydrolase)
MIDTETKEAFARNLPTTIDEFRRGTGQKPAFVFVSAADWTVNEVQERGLHRWGLHVRIDKTLPSGMVLVTGPRPDRAAYEQGIGAAKADPDNTVLFDTLEENLRDVLHEVARERRRQEAKFGYHEHYPMEYLSIIGEEYGEACRAANTSHWNAESLAAYREELVHLAATTIQAIQGLDMAGEEHDFTPAEREARV